MFYYLEGNIEELSPNLAVMDCRGIGFALNITMNTASQLKCGENAKLFISEAIGENNFDLYGFADKSEKRCFELLLSVSGVGPKAAVSILSHSTPESLSLAIMNNDAKALTVAPGIGKKIAQRVILELKDKVAKEFVSDDMSMPEVSSGTAEKSSQVSDAVAALGVLGYSSAEIMPAIKSINTSAMTAEQIIKAVLRQLAG